LVWFGVELTDPTKTLVNCSDGASLVPTILARHALPVLLTSVRSSLNNVVIPNFAGVLDIGNASFAVPVTPVMHALPA
jgi:hypothetical protein